MSLRSSKSKRSPTGAGRAHGLFVAALAAVALLAGGVAARTSAAPAATPTPTARTTPTLAYYYIWFTERSWDRAKTDYPSIGRYSSDEESVMRHQIQQAKQAHLDGFIVSWKSTPVLDGRLATLVRVAAEEKFKLVVIYQGLDFDRNPLPVARIERDLDRFIALYGRNDVFHVFGEKPAVVISGTWRFSQDDVARITTSRRRQLLLLASEKSVDGIARLAGLVDGDAYYWSSADPLRQNRYQQKLNEMSAAVHRSGGIWIAPAAAGFDARLIGGHRVIDRRDGGTLRQALDAAVVSSPDAIGVISWNEFSENSQIEPSSRYGDRSLRVLASFFGSELPAASDAQFRAAGDSDSSGPQGRSSRGLITLIGLIGVLALATPLLVKRRRRIRKARTGT